MAGTTPAALLEKHMAEVDKELDRLRPAFDEYTVLEQYKARMTGTEARPSAPRRTAGAGNTSAPRRRASGGAGPNRAHQMLQVLADTPGSTIPEIAKAIGDGVATNYLYRVRDALTDENSIVKNDSGGFVLTDSGKSALAELNAAPAAPVAQAA